MRLNFKRDRKQPIAYIYTETGDFVTCRNCDTTMLLPFGAVKCPNCKAKGTLEWEDVDLKKTAYANIRSFGFQIVQKNDLEPREYLSEAVLSEIIEC